MECLRGVCLSGCCYPPRLLHSGSECLLQQSVASTASLPSREQNREQSREGGSGEPGRMDGRGTVQTRLSVTGHMGKKRLFCIVEMWISAVIIFIMGDRCRLKCLCNPHLYNLKAFSPLIYIPKWTKLNNVKPKGMVLLLLLLIVIHSLIYVQNITLIIYVFKYITVVNWSARLMQRQFEHMSDNPFLTLVVVSQN